MRLALTGWCGMMRLNFIVRKGTKAIRYIFMRPEVVQIVISVQVWDHTGFLAVKTTISGRLLGHDVRVEILELRVDWDADGVRWGISSISPQEVVDVYSCTILVQKWDLKSWKYYVKCRDLTKLTRHTIGTLFLDLFVGFMKSNEQFTVGWLRWNFFSFFLSTKTSDFDMQARSSSSPKKVERTP